MHLHVFSRFYKRKQIADFLFASLDYKALPICLTLKKKRFCSKREQSLLKELIPIENEDPWGAHKIKRNNFASPKIVSLHLEFSV